METTLQNALLTKLKCDMVQGFLHWEPISADEVSELIANTCGKDDQSERLDVVDNLIAFRKDKK